MRSSRAILKLENVKIVHKSNSNEAMQSSFIYSSDWLDAEWLTAVDVSIRLPVLSLTIYSLHKHIGMMLHFVGELTKPSALSSYTSCRSPLILSHF